jgi:hypothetical protein
MLSERYPLDKLRTILLPRADYHPFPSVADRGDWEGILASVRQAHIARGQKMLGYDWPSLPATLFLDYVRNGVRSNYERQSFARRNGLRDLVIAECLEGKNRYLDDIVNGVWAICEETYWGVPAHINAQKAGTDLPDAAEPTVDLFAAETVALLAWTHYLLGDRLDTVSPLVRPRIVQEADRRILAPCLERDDFWWMGYAGRSVNNWNPWCNSNWLTATLLLEEDEERRLQSVAKIIRSLDKFIDPYPSDGGCDEGPGYWGRAGASLFDCLELLLSATDWAINVYDEPLIENMGRFIHRVQISGRYFINFADAPAVVTPSAPLVYHYGCRIGDTDMQAMGAWAAQDQGLFDKGLGDSIGRQLPALFIARKVQDATAAQPLPRDVWMDGIQVMVARDKAGADKGFFVAAKGGHNAESHNHNDVGNVVIYRDGRPVLIDAGVEAYSSKTFGPNRYDIWTMQSGYHNLPTVNGVMQAPGKQFEARYLSHAADEASASLTLDLAGAYPPEAGLQSWKRTVVLNRGRDVQIADTFEISESAEVTLNLLTPCKVVVDSAGRITFEEQTLGNGLPSGAAQLTYDPDALTASVEPIDVADDRLKGIWGDRLTRVVLKTTAPATNGSLTLTFSQ